MWANRRVSATTWTCWIRVVRARIRKSLTTSIRTLKVSCRENKIIEFYFSFFSHLLLFACLLARVVAYFPHQFHRQVYHIYQFCCHFSNHIFISLAAASAFHLPLATCHLLPVILHFLPLSLSLCVLVLSHLFAYCHFMLFNFNQHLTCTSFYALYFHPARSLCIYKHISIYIVFIRLPPHS